MNENRGGGRGRYYGSRGRGENHRGNGRGFRKKVPRGEGDPVDEGVNDGYDRSRGVVRRGGSNFRGRGQGKPHKESGEMPATLEGGRTNLETGERKVRQRGRGGSSFRGRGHPRQAWEEGERVDREDGRKVRDVKGDPNFWVKNGVVGDELRSNESME